MKLDFLGEAQREFLKVGAYIKEGETAEQRFQEIVERVRAYEFMYGEGLADRIQYLLEKNILSLSTPILANFGRAKKKGSNTTPLPVSCNILNVGNSISDIGYSIAETGMLSKLGAGVGAGFMSICDVNTEIEAGFFTSSKIPWIEKVVGMGQDVSQGSNRRGYVTPFMSIEDPEFDKLMEKVDKANPDSTGVLVDNTVGIIMPEGFRAKLDNKDAEARRRWLKVLKARDKDGRVYMVDIENLNKNQSPVYKTLGLTVNATNICTEAVTPNFDDKTFACVLSSLNLIYVDEILSNPQIVKDAITFLDIINEEYILLTKDVPFLEKARRSAIEKRDIGLGTLGFHEMLQMKGMSFGGFESRALNKKIYKFIRECAEEATKELAEKLGSPAMCHEAGLVRRNVSLLMIAPNKSTSFISGCTSLGIEPFFNNIFTKNLAKIQYVFKNKHLEALLETKGKNTPEVWESIAKNLGSVQHLDCLDQNEKDVFKTFPEVSPKDIIDLAADRQVYIDMAQSINLVFRPNYTLKDLHNMHKYAFDSGIKTLYYAYPQAHAALEVQGESWDTCISCAD